MSRLIFHVDVNSAYLSWEAARRVSLGEDDIRLIPSAIGGDRDKRTGVILAKSIPAKKFGIKTGEPVAMALRKCPDLFLARPDFMKRPPKHSWTSAENTHLLSRNTPSTSASWICPVPIRSIRIRLPLPIPSRTRSEIHWDLL